MVFGLMSWKQQLIDN